MEARINQANGRLKAANVRVRIRTKGNRLYLRATLPPKPGSGKTAPYQQDLALGITLTPAGISLAEKEARKISALLDCKQFDWTPYLEPTSRKAETFGEMIDKFQASFRHTVSDITWHTDYHEVFIKLDPNKPFSLEHLIELIESTEYNSRSRKRYCNALKKLALCAGFELDTKSLKGNYSAKSVNPRDLPTDEMIAEWYGRIKNPNWRYVYGLMAVYGLRPHECFLLDTTELREGGDTIRVMDGKTNRTKSREVWPFYPEWVDTFQLRSGTLPDVTARRNADYGERVSQYMRRNVQLPFNPYDLRHCWAVRTIHFGLPDSLSAQQMGHSLQVHNETYHAWIDRRTHEQFYQQLSMRADRPHAPVPVN